VPSRGTPANAAGILFSVVGSELLRAGQNRRWCPLAPDPRARSGGTLLVAITTIVLAAAVPWRPLTPGKEAGTMSIRPPTRLASEDVIINAPLSYAGSAQRIMRLRRRAQGGSALAAITVLAVLLMLVAWAAVTVWYVFWGIWLIPYRLLRRGARKRKAEAIRHRELMGTIQGSAAASAVAIVGATAVPPGSAPTVTPTVYSPTERIADADREGAIEGLRQHMLAGRLNSEEFEERIGLAHRARTRADLDDVGIDLPISPAAL
jgi:hypothetical protein